MLEKKELQISSLATFQSYIAKKKAKCVYTRTSGNKRSINTSKLNRFKYMEIARIGKVQVPWLKFCTHDWSFSSKFSFNFFPFVKSEFNTRGWNKRTWSVASKIIASRQNRKILLCKQVNIQKIVARGLIKRASKWIGKCFSRRFFRLFFCCVHAASASSHAKHFKDTSSKMCFDVLRVVAGFFFGRSRVCYRGTLPSNSHNKHVFFA